MKHNEAMRQAITDIRDDLRKQGKCFISISVRQLEEFRLLTA